MNDRDKDLISAYLDNELTLDERKYVESLIESDSSAFQYANQLKISNIEIDQFYKLDEFNELKNSVDNFIKDNFEAPSFYPLRSSKIFNFKISKILNPFAITGYAATALFMISLNQNLLLDNNTVNLESFNSESTAINIPKFKGNDTNSDIYKESIQIMVEKERKSANITYGSESFYIDLTNASEVNENICYEGTIYNQGRVNEFLFCMKGKSSSLLLNE